MADSLLEPGTRIGDWTVGRALGRPWASWSATGQGRRVSLTLPTVAAQPAAWPAGAPTPDPRRAMEAAEAQARVRHPNVVRVLDLLELHGVPVVVTEGADPTLQLMEFVGGSVDAVDAVVRDVAAGLGAVHEAKLVHGQVRGANVVAVFDEDRVVARVDGIARRPLEASQSAPWAAPECLRGSAPDVRSDVFMLGALAYHLIAGKPPFPGVTEDDVVAATLSGRFTRLEGVPDAMMEAIEGALAVDLRLRTKTVEEFVGAWTRGRPSPPADPHWLEAVRRFGA